MQKYLATTNPDISEREKRHLEAVRGMAAECMVILKNDGVLPLRRTEKIALYGNGARHTVKGGTGSGDVNVRTTVTVEEGLEREGFQVTTKDWLDRFDKAAEAHLTAHLTALQKQAEETGTAFRMLRILTPYNPLPMIPVTQEDLEKSGTETAVYVIARNSGEGGDRRDVKGDYRLSDDEEEAVRFLAKNYRKLVVLLNVGGPIDVTLLEKTPGVHAVVLLGQLGSVTGLAAADLLKGKAVPGGRLPDTWAGEYKNYPASDVFGANDGDTNDEYYEEDIYTGYRYFDTFNKPLVYEFGYGLSYTDFEIKTLKVQREGAEIVLTVRVVNTGDTYSGREVVQVYVSSPYGRLPKPYQELRAFAKTGVLAPGEEEVLHIRLKVSSFASYDPENGCRVLETGEYLIRVGSSSRKTKVVCKALLKQDVVTEGLKNHFFPDKLEPYSTEFEKPYSYKDEEEETDTAPVIVLDPADFSARTAVYEDAPAELPDLHKDHRITMDEVVSGAYTVDELTAQLTDEELTYLTVGEAARRGAAAVVDQRGCDLPGAAGETTGLLQDSRNILKMQLPDGPAGLRLVKEYVVKPDGRYVSAVDALGSETGDSPVEGVHHYQYATAIPIASSLAASWDLDLIERCGDIVGAEMEEFGASLWLAPGMNHHRNPLCGRNFEYYSEDPLLTGKCAAADTKGVQKHPGVGTTIKHFCANNQEDNRMFVNERISERAMREIYLRGFEIAVREAQPMAVMSSYNLVNGVHTANAREILTEVLRDEWGFGGLVMTDWCTTLDISFRQTNGKDLKYDKASARACIEAGNDLIMPGGMSDVEEILASVKDGTLSRGALQKCASRVLLQVSRSHLYEGAKPYGENVPGEIVTFTVE